MHSPNLKISPGLDLIWGHDRHSADCLLADPPHYAERFFDPYEVRRVAI